MAVSIEELIGSKENIKARKQSLYDVETSVGVLTVRPPSRALVAEVLDLDEGADEYLIFSTVVDPKLSDRKLQETFSCVEPTDIVGALLKPGEISAVAREIMRRSGYGQDIRSKLHEEAKN